MVEAVRKGYWPADAQTLKKMLETYTDIVNQHDVVTDNEKFTEFVKNQAAGFGLAPLLPGSTQATVNAAGQQQVSGQKLAQVEQKSKDSEHD
ncbi:hypothetical protein ACKI16_46730, partial [Streptomyces scabiei]|uniref:hypothetical protein n=1 Tax=Streptomyces scabiei TaxID=1930 RepID=UPI0038F612AE